jgi:hypothetical protein
MALHRRTGSRNWARGVLAFFWIVLAGVSGVYLFSAFSDPTALGGQLVALNPAPAGGSSGETTSALSPDQRDQELAEIKASLRELTQQMAELSAHLKPNEKDAARLPGSSGASAPPVYEPAAPSAETKKPEIAAVTPAPSPSPTPPAEEAKAKPEEKPAEATKPAETPEPEAKPVEQAAVEVKPTPPAPPEVKPTPKPFEPPPVAVSPIDDVPAEEQSEASSDLSAPAPPTPPAAEAQTPAASPPSPPAVTESAALDPVALPPAANDGSTRYGIEIGAVAKQDGLRPLWREFLTNHGALVAGLQPRRVLAPDKKWRLIAGPFSSAAEAAQACALFKKVSRPCEATVYAGDSL